MKTAIKSTLLIILVSLVSCSNVESATVPTVQPNTNISTNISRDDSDLWTTFIDLSNLETCQFPCFWGLTVGETNLEETLTFLEENEFDRAQSRSIYSEIPKTEYVMHSVYWLLFSERTNHNSLEIGDVVYDFNFDSNSILQGMGLRLRYITEWLPDEYNPLLLSTLLNEQDELPMIRVREGANLIISNIEILLNYPEERFRVTYQFTLSESYPLICINSDNITGISLGIGDRSEYALNEIYVPLAGSWLVRDSAISDEEFLQFFRDNPNTCLDLTQYP